MKLKKIAQEFTVCQVADLTEVDLSQTFCFIQKTDEELSVVCPTDAAPAHPLAREDGWRAFRIAGVLDFSLIGILARLSEILAENRISIFAVSTYNTDYILVKAADFARALAILADEGYTIV